MIQWIQLNGFDMIDMIQMNPIRFDSEITDKLGGKARFGLI